MSQYNEEKKEKKKINIKEEILNEIYPKKDFPLIKDLMFLTLSFFDSEEKIVRDKNKNTITTRTYFMGKKHGKEVVQYFRKDYGKATRFKCDVLFKKEISYYFLGKLHGVKKIYGINMSDEEFLLLEMSYKHGKKDGLKTIFDYNGKKISEIFYSDGNKNGKENWFYKNGNYWCSKIWKNGKLEKKTFWDCIGNETTENIIKNDKLYNLENNMTGENIEIF